MSKECTMSEVVFPCGICGTKYLTRSEAQACSKRLFGQPVFQRGVEVCSDETYYCSTPYYDCDGHPIKGELRRPGKVHLEGEVHVIDTYWVRVSNPCYTNSCLLCHRSETDQEVEVHAKTLRLC